MTTPTTQALLRTPFEPFHEKHGAHFVDFAGWRMPIHYGSILEEHKACREGAALFDVSHMGRLKFTGRHARRLLERLLTRRISDMVPGRCRYSLICNERGGVRDDVLIYRFEEHWLLVVNAANRRKILDHIEAVRGDLVFTVEDLTESTAMVALQGPKAMEKIGKFSSEVPTLKRYAFCTKNLLVLKMTISRTGYTGEDGVEVILDAGMAPKAIELLLAGRDQSVSVIPAGLGARDTLRLEAGMPLYGHELEEDIDPLSAGLDFAVSLDKGEEPNGERFIGQGALEKVAAAGPERKLIGLKLEGRRTPRQGMVVTDGGREVGGVTSGCLSPTLGYPIAMAYVERGSAEAGRSLGVVLSGQTVGAEVVALPFYKRG